MTDQGPLSGLSRAQAEIFYGNGNTVPRYQQPQPSIVGGIVGAFVGVWLYNRLSPAARRQRKAAQESARHTSAKYNRWPREAE
jgi:hypothetical protein